MGVDYNGVGGIGILLEFGNGRTVLDKLVVSGVFTKEEWEQDYESCLEKIGFDWDSVGCAGNAYCDELKIYLFVEGKNLKEIVNNEENFRKKFEKYNIYLKQEDLLKISEMRVS